MAQSKEFVDASHALNDLSHALALLESENASLRGAADGLCDENAKLRELAVLNWEWAHSCCGNNCKMQTEGCGYGIDRECNYEREIYNCMRELGIETKT